MSRYIDRTWYENTTGAPPRTACGGVVARCQDGQVLIALVRERNRPDYVLPKGGREIGESLEEAAIREIAEEAGITQLQLVTKLGIRERLSYTKSTWQIVHYYFFVTRQAVGKPTDTDRHDQVWWYPLSDLPAFFWPEQRELVGEHHELIISETMRLSNSCKT